MSSNEEHPGVKMVQKGEIRKEEDRKCPADDDESSELKYNLQIPEARSFSKMDKIEYFDKLPWIFGALGRSLTLNLKSRPPFFCPDQHSPQPSTSDLRSSLLDVIVPHLD